MWSGSSKRHKKSPLDPGDPPYEHPHMRMEMDSHADTCTLAQGHCAVLQDTGERVTVEGFGDAVQRVTGVPIATLAVAYDDPLTHSVYILVFHQALLVPRMKTHLINPLQIRNQGLEVHETLLQHLNPDERLPHSHSVICDEPPLHIPMTLRGTMSGFTVTLPTQEEIDDHEQLNTTWVHMTKMHLGSPTLQSLLPLRIVLDLQWIEALNFITLSPEI